LYESAEAKKTVRGLVTGGNLVVLQSTLGTPWHYRPDGIVFFEETGERGYRVDRILNHMEQAGVFKKAKAVIFADFLGGKEPQTEVEHWSLAINSFAKKMKIPVLKGLSAGHGIPNRPVPIGAKGELVLSKEIRFSIGSGGKPGAKK
jgi:muramoyltetrapeptide carboxypeptidase